MKRKQRVPHDVSIYLCYLHQDRGDQCLELVKRFPIYSERSIYRHCPSIPVRSPDINPIENLFNLVHNKLEEDALINNITREDFETFSTRVKETIKTFPVEIIVKTIESMNRRMKYEQTKCT